MFSYTSALPPVSSSVLAPKSIEHTEDYLEQEEEEWQKLKFELLDHADNKFYGKSNCCPTVDNSHFVCLKLLYIA